MVAFDLHLQVLAAELGAVRVAVEAITDADDLRLLLAKIAHCMAVAFAGIDNFEPYLIDLLLAKNGPALKRFVGRWDRPGRETISPTSSKFSGTPMHKLSIRFHQKRKSQFIIAQIALFDLLGLASYEVVCGRMYSNSYALGPNIPDHEKEFFPTSPWQFAMVEQLSQGHPSNPR